MGSIWNLRRLLRAALLAGLVAALLGVPLAASANPDIDGFELDGNAVAGGKDDWGDGALPNALAGTFTGFRVDPTDDDDTGYGSGQTKDTADVSEWTWEAADVTPAKSDIVNDYAVMYAEDGNLILYFGQNRQLDRSGDANVGFWFLQNGIGLDDDDSFSGTHADGDLLVQSEFTNGGSISGIRVYKWQSGDITEVTSNVGQCAGDKLGTLDACAIVNSGSISTSWAGSLTAPYFYEGGVNLTALFQQSVPCFSTFLTNTRTSQSESADLKDFGLGEIDTCASLEITKQATPSDGTQFGYSTTGGLSPGTFSLASGGTQEFMKLQPGQYSVTENAPPAGWALDSLTCPVATGPGTSAQTSGATASITLGFVGHVECTYVNKRQPQVKVVKELEPASDPGKFDLRINGTTYADEVGDGGDTGFQQVAPGQVTVDEFAGAATVLGDYVSSVSCDSGKGSASSTSHAFSIDFGDRVTCTITNARKGKIVVEKQTNPNGAAQVFTFDASYDQDGFSLSDGQQNDSGPLASGTYSVSENVPAGWSLDSATCDDGSAPSSIALGAGETVKCTFTNEKEGQVVVRKVMVGGTDTFDFTGTPAGSISANNGTLAQSVVAGQHVSTEAAKAGWDLTSVSCSDQNSSGSVENRQATFNVEPGETVTCTFTNRKQSKIVVEKQTNPDGDPQSFAFAASYDGDGFSLTDGQQNDSGPLAPGTFSVSETVPAGWDLESAVCSDQSPASAISLQAGETVTCVFTNEKDAKIVVEKQTSPDGSPQSFSFTRSYGAGFQLSDGQQHDSGDLDPGTYSVAETVAAGWTLTSAVCSDQSPANAIQLAAGETVTCVFTNTVKPGKIVVQKQTNPDGDPQSFGFTTSYDQDGFSLTDGQSNDSGPLAPGSYSVAETVPAGWDLESAVCSDGSPANAIAVAPDETVTCVFTNEKDANIVVQKQTSPDGDPQAFSFAASYDGDGFSLADGQSNDSGDLDPGTYSVSENVPAGWDLLSAVCSDQSPASAIALQAGETVTCVFTNEKDAKIVVEKQTDPDGEPKVFSFTASYQANGFQLSDGQQNDSGDLAPGTYSVSETVPANWTLTSAACSDQSPVDAIVLAAGETVTCVFTNTLDRGRIVVEKQTNPDGDPQAFQFAASYDADGFSLADGQQNTSGLLLPGTYSVSETVPAGWDLEAAVCSDGSPASAVALAPGEVVTCVFTNEKDASIVVQKQTLPNGDPQSFHFDASYDANGFDLVDDGQNDSGDLDPGTYSVSEDLPAGWDLDSAVCSDQSPASAIVLEAGEVVACVFTNEKDAKIIVEKQTLPNGDPQPFHFDASYDEGGFDLVDDQQSDSGDLDPGTYDVSEDVPAGWDLTSAVCSDESDPEAIELSAGETVTCVFTNTKRGSIVVEKQTLPNGAAGTFTFAGDAAGAIVDDGTIVVPNLEPGTYVSTEGAAPGFNLTGIACDDSNSTGNVGTRTATFELQAGETVTCTFTNTLIPTITSQGSIDVQKSADPTSVKEPGGAVDFTVTITNTSNVGVTITNVVDSVFGDLDDTDGSGVFDVPINLAPGEKVSKTFQRQVTGSAGQVHTNVVTASGTDENGNPVSDSDDARVEITPRLIDLVIVKTASSPTPLNGIVNYTLTVTNKGPDTATNVQVADPAPSGITYLTVNPSKGSCNLTASLITCSLGSLAAGETASIDVTARATAVGTHTNVATTTGAGGRETNPADNVDDAVTVVPAPFTPPARPKPKAKPQPVCLTLTVSPKMITADGKPDRVRVRVTAGKKRVKGTRVVVFGAGVRRSSRSNGKGLAVITVNPRKAGLITITARETNQRVCGPKRIGVVGVFLPPLAG